MSRYNWKLLNKQQVGAYAEYFVKMELTMHGFQVYSTEVDDRGIDFVARRESGPFIEVQVKSVRSSKYVFMRKDKFPIREETHLALCVFTEGQEPQLFLVPSLVWSTANSVFVNREYGEGMKSKPEWGLNVNPKNMPVLAKYRFEATIESLGN